MQNPEVLHGKLDSYALPEFEMPYQPPVLPVDLYLRIEKERYIQTDNTLKVEMENIHNKAVFDGLNEALDCMRPYGLRGPPVPWSKQAKTLTFKYGTVEALPEVFSEAKRRVMAWTRCRAGGIETGPRAERIKEERL